MPGTLLSLYLFFPDMYEGVPNSCMIDSKISPLKLGSRPEEPANTLSLPSFSGYLQWLLVSASLLHLSLPLLAVALFLLPDCSHLPEGRHWQPRRGSRFNLHAKKKGGLPRTGSCRTELTSFPRQRSEPAST